MTQILHKSVADPESEESGAPGFGVNLWDLLKQKLLTFSDIA